MPPKRTGARARGSAEVAGVQENPGFSKPFLPALQGTPSSRRSYAYGAPVEPPPPTLRPSWAETGEQVDLVSAVRNIQVQLAAEEAEEQAELGLQEGRKPWEPILQAPSQPAPRTPTPARQTGEDNAHPAIATPSPIKTPTPPPAVQKSTPRPARQPAATAPPAKEPIPPPQQPTRIKTEPHHVSFADDATDDDDSRTFNEESDFYMDATLSPAVNRRPALSKSHSKASTKALSKAPSKAPSKASSSKRIKSSRSTRHQSPLRQSIEVDHEILPISRNIREHAPVLLPPRQPTPIQPPMKHMDRSHFLTQPAATKESYMQSPDSNTSFKTAPLGVDSTNIPLRRLETRRVPYVPAPTCWRFFNPLTYVKAIFCFFAAILQWTTRKVRAVVSSETGKSFFATVQALFYLVLAIIIIFFVTLLVSALVGQLREYDLNDVFPEERVKTTTKPKPSYFSGISSQVSSYLQSPPPRSMQLHQLQDMFAQSNLDLDLASGIYNYLEQFQTRMEAQHGILRVHDKAIAELAPILPKALFMQSDGKTLGITDEFWHALRDIIFNDDKMLTLAVENQGIVFKPDWLEDRFMDDIAHHKAIQRRINFLTQDVEDRIRGQFTTLWDEWKKDNEAMTRKLLGVENSRKESGLSREQVDERIAQAMESQARSAEKSRKAKVETPPKEPTLSMKQIEERITQVVKEQVQYTRDYSEKQVGERIAQAFKEQAKHAKEPGLSAKQVDERITLALKEHDRLRYEPHLSEKQITERIAKALKEHAKNVEEIEERISQALKEQNKHAGTKASKNSDNIEGKIVTREEFLRHVERELQAQRTSILAKMAEMRPQMEKMVYSLLEQSAQAAPSPGMERKEIARMIDDLVEERLAHLSLKSAAEGKILSTWNTRLKHMINYFDKGHGAIINPTHSTVRYDPFKAAYVSDQMSKHGYLSRRQSQRGIKQPLEAHAALEPWSDAGDCWCSFREKNIWGAHYDTRLSVQLGYLVIPQYIVMEHMLPGATTDPGARPRNVEVWAKITDPAIRQLMRDFSNLNFPDPDESTSEGRNYWPLDQRDDEFVKIGQFVYQDFTLGGSTGNAMHGGRDNAINMGEDSAINGGVHIYRLKETLVEAGAATDEIIVRAIDNYGAEDHTCFYRVRMYGVNADQYPSGDQA